MTPDDVAIPVVTTEPQTVAHVLMACQVCGIPVPLSIDVWVGVDDDGDDALFTGGSTLDLEAHLASHGRVTLRGAP